MLSNHVYTYHLFKVNIGKLEPIIIRQTVNQSDVNSLGHRELHSGGD